MDTNFLLWPSPHHGCQLEVRNKAPNLHNLKSSLIKEQNFPLQNMKLCLVSFFKPSFFQPYGRTFSSSSMKSQIPIIPTHLSIFNGHSLSISRVNIILGPCLSVSESGWVISLGLTQFWAQVGRVGGGESINTGGVKDIAAGSNCTQREQDIVGEGKNTKNSTQSNSWDDMKEEILLLQWKRVCKERRMVFFVRLSPSRWCNVHVSEPAAKLRLKKRSHSKERSTEDSTSLHTLRSSHSL